MVQKSFIEVPPDSDFPIQNLPYGIFTPYGESAKRAGVAIGDYVLDLAMIEKAGFFSDVLRYASTFNQPSLNRFMIQGRSAWRGVRAVLIDILSEQTPFLRDNPDLRERAFFPLNKVRLYMPVEIGDYTDFYASREHATNVGSMFRDPQNALLPNWLRLPVGYHGRASSVIVSGTPIHRPKGQFVSQEQNELIFAPTQKLDFELEVGFIVGSGNNMGEPIPAKEAIEHIFGMVLLNDWSARDIQSWEYQPLGPFLSKSFASTISPWVVPMDALEPFRCEGPEQDPAPLPYLITKGQFSFDINLEVYIQSKKMAYPALVAASNYKTMYWNIAQQLAHHTITGCNMRTGDLCGSGTISGRTRETFGSLLELTWNGKYPLILPDNTLRSFLEDGDTVSLYGWAENRKFRIGFGTATGQIID